jgi:hypothetical protein
MAPSSRYGLHEFDQTTNQPAECYEKVATLFFFPSPIFFPAAQAQARPRGVSSFSRSLYFSSPLLLLGRLLFVADFG